MIPPTRGMTDQIPLDGKSYILGMRTAITLENEGSVLKPERAQGLK